MILKFRVLSHIAASTYRDGKARIFLKCAEADAANGMYVQVDSLADYPLEHEFSMQTVTPETAAVAFNAAMQREADEAERRIWRSWKADCQHNWSGGYCDLCGTIREV